MAKRTLKAPRKGQENPPDAEKPSRAASLRAQQAERARIIAALGWAPEAPGAAERYCATTGELAQTLAEKQAAARPLARADAEYVQTAGSLEGQGCRLYPQGKGEWCSVLPSGGAMCFGAADLAAALARVMDDYAEHEGCAAFFAECRRAKP